jgi:hypothetical protein
MKCSYGSYGALFLAFFILMAYSGLCASKILLVVKEGSTELEFMLSHEVLKMSDFLKTSGFIMPCMALGIDPGKSRPFKGKKICPGQ